MWDLELYIYNREGAGVTGTPSTMGLQPSKENKNQRKSARSAWSVTFRCVYRVVLGVDYKGVVSGSESVTLSDVCVTTSASMNGADTRSVSSLIIAAGG